MTNDELDDTRTPGENECLLHAEETCNGRADTIAEQLTVGLRLAAMRDRLFVDLFRAKTERKAERDRRAKALTSEAVAEARAEVDVNGERVATVLAVAADQLAGCADELRKDDWGGGGDVEEMAALARENRCLAETVTMRQAKLDKMTADVRSAGVRLDCEQNANQRLRCRLIAADRKSCDKCCPGV